VLRQRTEDLPVGRGVSHGAVMTKLCCEVEVLEGPEVDRVATGEQSSESLVRIVLLEIIETACCARVSTMADNGRRKRLVQRPSGESSDILGKRAKHAERVMASIVENTSLVISEPDTTGRNLGNRIEHCICVASVAEVFQTAVRGVDQI